MDKNTFFFSLNPSLIWSKKEFDGAIENKSQVMGISPPALGWSDIIVRYLSKYSCHLPVLPAYYKYIYGWSTSISFCRSTSVDTHYFACIQISKLSENILDPSVLLFPECGFAGIEYINWAADPFYTVLLLEIVLCVTRRRNFAPTIKSDNPQGRRGQPTVLLSQAKCQGEEK